MNAHELGDYNRAQIQEIQKYKWEESQRTGYDIGVRRAALEWIDKYSHLFHDWYSNQKKL